MRTILILSEKELKAPGNSPHFVSDFAVDCSKADYVFFKS